MIGMPIEKMIAVMVFIVTITLIVFSFINHSDKNGVVFQSEADKLIESCASKKYDIEYGSGGSVDSFSCD